MRIPVSLFFGVMVCYAGEVQSPSFPYEGEITGNAVNIRAGFGVNYRSLKKVDKGYRVLVKSKKGEWLEIEIPSDCELWISKKYIALQPDGRTGILTGDRVNVRTDPKLKGNVNVVGQLNRDDSVEVVGEEGDWFKIKAPAGFSAWVQAGYVKAVPPPEPKVVQAPRSEPKRPEPAVIKAKLELAQEALSKQLQRPLLKRDYSVVMGILKEVTEVARDEEIKLRAKAFLDQVKVLEAIRADAEKLAEAKAKLAEEKKEYEEAVSALEKKSREMGEVRIKDALGPAYLAVGRVERLLVLGERPATHKLVKNGEVLYVLRSDKLKLDEYVGKEVGVKGRVVDLRPRWRTPIIKVTELAVLGE